jgi:hypothetical protein
MRRKSWEETVQDSHLVQIQEGQEGQEGEIRPSASGDNSTAKKLSRSRLTSHHRSVRGGLIDLALHTVGAVK